MEPELYPAEAPPLAPVPIPMAAPVTVPAARAHHVQFYENDHFLAAAVADFIADGLRSGQTVVTIATATHRDSFALRLKAKGIDALAATNSGKLISLDAHTTLASFMDSGRPDATRFRAEVGSVIDSVVRENRTAGVRAYGEMVDILWRDGNLEAAIELEKHWNTLQEEHQFVLLCAYALGNFYKTSHADALDRVCSTHTHVLPSERYLDLDEPGRMREVALLQQKARSLETEIEHREELEQRLRIALTTKLQAEDDLRRAAAERELLLQRERAARAEAESASRAKSDFLTAMSHELRTPLNAIGGHVQLLEMGIHGPIVQAQREALGRIERSQRHLLALINDILNLARIEAGRVEYKAEEVVLTDVVRELREMLEPLLLQRALNFKVRADVTPIGSRSLVARGDHEKVHQILLNLLSNAIKFTPAHGTISVTIGVVLEGGRKAVVEVTDTGVGIDPAKLESIFHPFVQLALRPAGNDGVGLGLSISRELARGMHGELVATSVPGKGSTFILTLPLA
jgi:signal transduction histidine kinase